MALTIEVVRSKKQRKAFVNLQFEIYKNTPVWAPPIKADEEKAIDPAHNPAMEYSESEYWLCYRDSKVVGRIGAIINAKYNEKTGKKFGRFSRIEFIDDKEVFILLMDTAVEWIKERGMELIHGPLGYSNLDTQGMLIEGFDHLQSITSVHHMPYYKVHLDAYGFEKEIDWIEFRLTLGGRANEKGERGAEIVKKRYGFTVEKFTKNKQMLPYVKPIFEVLNEAFTKLPYVTPFNEKMVESYKNKYFKLINPKFVFIAKNEGDIIGFMIAVPSLSEAMQKAKGSLFPFGFYHIRKAMKKPDVLDFFIIGVMPEYDRSGVAAILFNEIHKEMRKQGIKTMETGGIFETNHNVINNWKNYDHIQHRRRRCFIKAI
ncbi:MAG: GNAT family N-acetyltransferase [Bacteroidales bacterium]|jgi:GNAT superfamily N-acetyltransferase|nr:GNAT family N-acetyltransferase [Bacteroidales bacterium]